MLDGRYSMAEATTVHGRSQARTPTRRGRGQPQRATYSAQCIMQRTYAYAYRTGGADMRLWATDVDSGCRRVVVDPGCRPTKCAGRRTYEASTGSLCICTCARVCMHGAPVLSLVRCRLSFKFALSMCSVRSLLLFLSLSLSSVVCRCRSRLGNTILTCRDAYTPMVVTTDRLVWTPDSGVLRLCLCLCPCLCLCHSYVYAIRMSSLLVAHARLRPRSHNLWRAPICNPDLDSSSTQPESKTPATRPSRRMHILHIRVS